MSKTKRKAKQQNFLNYFLNEFVFFRRDFVFVTHLSLEETAENLRHLSYQKQGCWRKRRIKAETFDNLSEISFEVKSEQPAKSGYSQSAKASGRIFSDDDGITVIEGSVTMGGLAYWLGVIFLIGYSFFMYWRIDSMPPEVTPSEGLLLIPIFFGAALIYMWLRMYSDRNYLANIIEQAVSSEKVKIGA